MFAYQLISTQEKNEQDATDVFVIGYQVNGSSTNDFATFANGTQLVLKSISPGDFIMAGRIDVLTAVVGPTGTPTVSIGISGVSATQITGTLSAVAVGYNLNGGAGVPYRAPASLAANTNIVLDLEAGGGNGAAATAGLIKVYIKHFRQADMQRISG